MKKIDFNTIKGSAPVLVALAVLVFLWIKFETAKKEEVAIVKDETEVTQRKNIVERLRFSENFEGGSKIGFTPNTEFQYEGKTSAYMGKDYVYGPTFICDSTQLIKSLDDAEISFLIFTKEPIDNMRLGFSIGDKKENFMYEAPLVETIEATNVWVKRTVILPIDKKMISQKNVPLELRVYLINEGKEFYIDKFDVKLNSKK